MTASAVLVLSVALACFTIGVTAERPADYDNMHTNMQSETENNLYSTDKTENKPDLKMKTRTNVNNILDKPNFNQYDNERSTDVNKYDVAFTEDVLDRNLNKHRYTIDRLEHEEGLRKFTLDFLPKRRVKRDDEQDARCEAFAFDNKDKKYITHPHGKDSKDNHYYSNLNCVTVITGGEGTVVQLTFVDMFHIEYHPECSYDYLEIRDGLRGYAKMLGKVCGEAFPRQITTSGPNAWLKFRSDDTIEYEGFRINIEFIRSSTSVSIPESCYMKLDGNNGVIDSAKIDPDCLSRSANQPLDVLWSISVPANHKIYLNFSTYNLAKPNECEDNGVQVFGHVLEYQAKLAHYCGSVANAVTTKGSDSGGKGGRDDKGNIMYVRLYATKSGRGSSFSANFTAYRTLDPNNDDKCDKEKEFDCEDNTCIDLMLRCDGYANCRLKADEEYELCKGEAESMISKPHIMVILVIFSLILSGMSFVFLFKCIRKLYQDHKIIKEHIRQSCEDRLDTMVSSRLILDAKRLQRDSEPRASLERENHTNEMFKQQRKFSQQKIRPTSIDSDFVQETRLDLEEDPWRREAESVPVEPEEVRIERNGRSRRSDISKKEESIRSKRESEKKEIRDMSVGVPDTKESGCQTRESLFQTDTALSSDGSNTTNSRGFSTFGYSGATIARRSPPAPSNKSQITIELLSQVTPQPEPKPQKKIPDRRPMSTETTRSAPDVIIVSKPIR